jgi:hypothetical protein
MNVGDDGCATQGLPNVGVKREPFSHEHAFSCNHHGSTRVEESGPTDVRVGERLDGESVSKVRPGLAHLTAARSHVLHHLRKS